MRCCCSTICNPIAGRLQTLQDWRWNPLVYTRTAGDALYNLLARDFAPAPERSAEPRQASRRDPALPRAGARSAGSGASSEGTRGNRVEAERWPESDARRRNHGADRHAPAGRAGALRASLAKARSAVSQHQIWLDKRLLPEAKGDFRLGSALYDQKLAFALFSPLSRQEIRARAESELAATRSAMYDIASHRAQEEEGAAPRHPKNPAPLNSSAPSRPRSISLTRNARSATRCSTPRAPLWPRPRVSCARRIS